MLFMILRAIFHLVWTCLQCTIAAHISTIYPYSMTIVYDTHISYPYALWTYYMVFSAYSYHLSLSLIITYGVILRPLCRHVCDVIRLHLFTIFLSHIPILHATPISLSLLLTDNYSHLTLPSQASYAHTLAED